MLRVALRPRFLGMLALMIVATLACGLLATWQWDRAHQVITDQAAEPAQLGDIRGVLAVGDPVTNEMAGEIVTVTGSFVPGEQILVPGRKIGGTPAVLVISSLLVDQGDGTRARLPVARGWLPAAEVTDADGRLAPALVPEAPQGEIEISGQLEASEAASGGVDGAVAREIATPMLVNEWGSPMYSGYVSLAEPSGTLRTLPEAESDFSRGLNWQNIGYSFQWVAFGGFFLFLWWRSVRATHLDEVADRREAMQELLGEDDPLPTRSPAVVTTTAPPSDKDV
ncbi:SURF1 family protein [Brachybacterium vulturis]|uniref:SURF1 family protein n=1 Tax=Brachybacterium vulturis TaxID=2017484 RepID=UPI00373685E6